jgi:hypothetical protein
MYTPYLSGECCYPNSGFHTYYSCAGTILGSCTTAIPPTQCAFMIVSVSVLTPFIALGSNGERSKVFSSLITPGLVTPTNLCLYYDVCPEIAENTRLGHLWGASLGKDLRLNDKYICPKDNSGTCSCVYYKQLYCPCWVMKGGQLSLKGRSIPHI